MEPRELLVVEKETYGTPLAWLSFLMFIVMLTVIDVTCLQPPVTSGRMSLATSAKLTAFWFAMGIVFDIFLACSYGFDAGVGFLQGLLLEYMLSFDNLFVFHLVFAYYCTPEHLLYRALYYGIAGAIILRMFFLLIGGTLFGMGMYPVKFFFGAVLIWSGIKSANDIEEDEDNPTNNPFIAWVTKHFPVSDNYEPHGRFFVTVAEVECRPVHQRTATEDEISMIDEESGGAASVSSEAGPTFPRLESFEGASLLEPQHRSSSRRSPLQSEEPRWAAGRTDSTEFEVTRPRGRLKRKASLLLLVVVAVWVVDLIFAVDSVASKLAVVTDLFLNCSSSAFAMLSLRSLYFMMESMVETFQMLKYGIAAVLILLGLKLVFAGYVEVSSPVCFAIIMAICVGSMAASYWLPQFRHGSNRRDFEEDGQPELSPDEEDEEDGDHDRSTANIIRAPYMESNISGTSPVLTSSAPPAYASDEEDESSGAMDTRLAAMEAALKVGVAPRTAGSSSPMSTPIRVEAVDIPMSSVIMVEAVDIPMSTPVMVEAVESRTDLLGEDPAPLPAPAMVEAVESRTDLVGEDPNTDLSIEDPIPISAPVVVDAAEPTTDLLVEDTIPISAPVVVDAAEPNTDLLGEDPIVVEATEPPTDLLTAEPGE